MKFFVANIRNTHTRRAYARQVMQFLAWREGRGAGQLGDVRPVMVAAYIEQMPGEPQTVKQSFSAIRMLYDWPVIGQIVPTNPAGSVRAPKYTLKKGKTLVLSRADAPVLLDGIDAGHLIGLRDRALIDLMTYSFARIGAVTGMSVGDYYQSGKRW